MAMLGDSIAGAQESGSGPVATVSFKQTGIEWQANDSSDYLVLTVSMPGGAVFQEEFPPGTTPNFQAVDEFGNPRPDGQYAYELVEIIFLDEASRRINSI